jgi:hypothetical protein
MSFYEIMNKFRQRGEVRGKELLLTPGDALEALLLCERSDVAVVGVEAFRLHGDTTEPLQNLIADCSPPPSANWRSYCENANTCARQFLGQLPHLQSLYVSLVGLDAPV